MNIHIFVCVRMYIYINLELCNEVFSLFLYLFLYLLVFLFIFLRAISATTVAADVVGRVAIFFLSDVVVQRKSAVKCSFQCSSFLAFCWHNMVIIIIIIIPYGMYIYLYECMYVCMSESYFSISTNSSLLIEH